MLGLARWNPFEEIFNVQREVDRLFNQFWNDLPTRTFGAYPSFQVRSDDNQWTLDVPLPGVDPANVTLEATGNTLTVRVSEPKGEGKSDAVTRYEQSITVPQFLDLDRVSASFYHGMLRVTLPLKESVKPRRIAIETTGHEQKQLAA